MVQFDDRDKAQQEINVEHSFSKQMKISGEIKVEEIKDVERVQRIAAGGVMGRVRRWRWENNERGEAVRVPESPTEMITAIGWQTMRERRKWESLCNY